MRERAVSCDTHINNNNKKPIIKLIRAFSEPIEMGNGYGYFCNIDSSEKKELINNTLDFDIGISIEEEEEEESRKKSQLISNKLTTKCCCCIPFLLLLCICIAFT